MKQKLQAGARDRPFSFFSFSACLRYDMGDLSALWDEVNTLKTQNAALAEGNNGLKKDFKAFQKKSKTELSRVETELAQVKDKLSRVETELSSAKDELSRVKTELARVKDELGRVDKALAKIQIRDLLKAFRFCLVETFASHIGCVDVNGNPIPSARDDAESRKEFWLKRDRHKQFITLLLGAISGGGDKILIKRIRKVVPDLKKSVKAAEWCVPSIQKQYDELAHTFDIIDGEMIREEFNAGAAKITTERLSPVMFESTSTMVDVLASEHTVWPTKKSPSKANRSTRNRPRSAGPTRDNSKRRKSEVETCSNVDKSSQEYMQLLL
jgi:predicted nuclease with TOPRIM domain